MSSRLFHVTNSLWIIVLAWLAVPSVGLSQGATTLTNAAQVRNLTVQEASRGLPVHIQGIVLADSAGGNSLVVQDDSEAIYTIGSPVVVIKFRRGDLIEITGVTDPGGFAPIINIRSCKKIGSAPIPDPKKVTFDDLMRKHYDAQFVEISGVVRSCEPSSDSNDIRTKMVVETGGERLAVRLHTRLPAGSLVDAEVRLRGICFSRYTASRQFLTPLLDIPRGVEPHVEKPAPKNPWDTPLISAVDMLQFAPERDYGHRVRVHGIVTSQQPGTIWLRDGKSGLRAFSSQNINLQPGDVVDALGFPGTQGSYSPVIEDSVFKRITNSSPPVPVLVTNLSAAVHQDAGLIQLEAKLNARRPIQDGWALTLGWQGKIIEAQIYLTNGVALPVDWLPGSLVRVAGICSVDAAPADTALSGVWEPSSFNLTIRFPADLTVLQSPPWWTPAHVILVLGAVIGGLLLVTGVVALFARRRLNEQERQRAMAEAEFTAILSERNRVAREIHDTLAQGLVATSVQLRLAKKTAASAPESLGQYLDTAQQLVSSSLEEARKSIWNMRSQVLETGDLSSALQGILKQMADGSDLKTAFEITGRACRLAPVIESNLLRVGQEAITNAAKHAQAKNLLVRLQFSEKEFCLVVKDDGKGFDPASPPRSDGGFGLVGMRERAAELKGVLTIGSSVGAGTEIKFTVPLTGD